MRHPTGHGTAALLAQESVVQPATLPYPTLPYHRAKDRACK